MAEPHVEVELKFAATPDALERLAVADRLGPALLGTTVRNDETDRYLDTDDGRLAAAGWACRLRTRRVAGTSRTFASLKGPAERISGGVHRRPEVEGPATDALDPAAWPASAATELIERLRGGATLHERFALAQLRRERPVTDDGGPIGTLSLDDVTVLRDGRPVGGLHVIELELAAEGGEAVLAALGDALAEIPGVVADRRSKLEHAVRMLDGLVEGVTT